MTSELAVLTEKELAARRADEGGRIFLRDGRYWCSTRVGLCQPVHIMGRFAASEATRPSPYCWGYRVALKDEDRDQANAAVPLYLLADVDAFSQGLSRNRKGDLRKCRRFVEFRALRDASLLLEQGHRVFVSAASRTGRWKPPTEVEYRRHVRRSLSGGRVMIVAGLIDGNLAGYLVACAVDGILYLENIFVCSDACRTGIGTGLYVAAIENALRSGRVREICNGFHTPELPGICQFKESLGFAVANLPARLAMPPLALAVIRARRPATYYRLTGNLPECLLEPST